MRRIRRSDIDAARKITRRGMLLGSIQGVFIGVLALRMRYLQVEQADQFSAMF